MICDCCGEDKPDVGKRRRSTAYVNDALNYVNLCDECYKAEEEFWQEQWEEYWGEQ